MIYHVVIESDFRAQFDDLVYSPSGLHADGFVHCAFEPSVVPVANDYFAGAPGRLLLLEIDPTLLTSESWAAGLLIWRVPRSSRMSTVRSIERPSPALRCSAGPRVALSGRAVSFPSTHS
jgi:hypothetical protein